MKNNQQKNRNHQPRQPQQHIPAEVLKRLTVLGADINISEGVTVPIPREEYDELTANPLPFIVREDREGKPRREFIDFKTTTGGNRFNVQENTDRPTADRLQTTDYGIHICCSLSVVGCQLSVVLIT